MATKIKKVLCVCMGNKDRSPAMAATLDTFFRNAGWEVVCEGAGVGENARKGGPAGSFAVVATRRIGTAIDLARHRQRHISSLDLGEFDLFVCASDEIAHQVMGAGVDVGSIYNVDIRDPWPCQFQEDYDVTFGLILAAMYRVVARYAGRFDS